MKTGDSILLFVGLSTVFTWPLANAPVIWEIVPVKGKSVCRYGDVAFVLTVKCVTFLVGSGGFINIFPAKFVRFF